MALQPRPIRVEGDIAYVPLTKGYEAVIDAVDVPHVGGHNWFASENGHTVYARRVDVRNGTRENIAMHRAIMGAPNGQQVDHVDGDGLNNRKKTNLRLATASQNACNRKLSKANTSGFKGVSFNKRDKAWQAHIKINGTKKSLGYFDTPRCAAAAYEAASREIHGAFGRVG